MNPQAAKLRRSRLTLILLGVLFVRTEREPAALAAAVRGAVRELDRNLVIRDIKTMQERISDAGSKMRFGAWLLALFAAIPTDGGPAPVRAAVGCAAGLGCNGNPLR